MAVKDSVKFHQVKPLFSGERCLDIHPEAVLDMLWAGTGTLGRFYDSI